MIVDMSALIAILCKAPKALSCATNQSFELSMRYADGVLSIATHNHRLCDALFWQNEAKMVNIFKGDRLNAHLTAAGRFARWRPFY